MAKQADLKSVLKRILQIAALIIIILSFGCGTFLLITGIVQTKTISDARDTLSAAEVKVTALEQKGSFNSMQIVVVEAESPEIAKQLGITSAAVWRANVQVGDKLTMYYDPDDEQNRIIDFRTNDDHKQQGYILFGISAAFSILFVILRKKLS